MVHMGGGNFHRAHQSWYTDRADTDRDWGTAAFTGRHPKIALQLGPQGGLYILIERGPQSKHASIISSIAEIQDGANVGRFVEVMSRTETALVVTGRPYVRPCVARSGAACPHGSTSNTRTSAWLTLVPWNRQPRSRQSGWVSMQDGFV